MIDWFIEPWGWGDFMWRAALATFLVTLICVPVGVFLYLRRLSLMSDAMSHTVLPGIVVAYLIVGSLSPAVLLPGAALAGILAALGIARLGQVKSIRPDAAMATVFTSFFALGVILLSTKARHAHIDTDCVLFGNVLGVTNDTLVMLGVSSILTILLVLVFWRYLSLSTFDSTFAASIGIPVIVIHYGLMAAVSVGAVASFEAVGAVLVIAFFVVPAATAHHLSRTLSGMLGSAFLVSILSAVIGLYASVYLNTSTAGAIVVTQGLVYFLILFLKSGALRRGHDANYVRRELPQDDL